MKLPVNFLLYLVSIALLGVAGYTFYRALPRGSVKAFEGSSNKGIEDAKARLAKGKGQGPVTSSWNYATPWWRNAFLAPNLLGKDPPKVGETAPAVKEEDLPRPADMRPVDEVIELLAVVYDGSAAGKGGESHVIVRYKDGVQVVPPLWYLRENPTTMAGSALGMGPADAVAAQAGGRDRRRGQSQATAPTPMPTSSAGRDILQRVFAAGDGSIRFEATLWPPHDDIRLVRVAPDARSAFFVRLPQPPKEGEEPGPAPAEQELFRSTLSYSKEAQQAIAELLRKEDAERLRQTQGRDSSASGPAVSAWRDVEETTRIDNVYHVARKEDPDRLLERVSVESYVSRTGTGLKGLRVTNVAPDVAARFGVQQNDVLLAVNGVPVTTRAEALNVGKRLYNRGTRTFVLRFLSNGSEIERTYQAPDR